ncbi:MAG: hypothetical protein PHQ72_10195 [Hespellia sp.]|jgi:hypothetical protein|nr:hypothetical protein [Hespellia sp.]
MALQDNLRKSGETYRAGYTCSQAVFCAFAKEMNREEVFEKVKKASEIFQKEYGGITCKEILRGECPKQFGCGMKVKDAILIISQILEERK